jgi:hypothetical protein
MLHTSVQEDKMETVKRLLANEPLRARVYAALVALLPLLASFGVDLTDGQTQAVLGLAYVLLIGATEAARTKVTPAA